MGSVLLNAQVRHQKIKDFGHSACWWGTSFGGTPESDRILDLLHTKKGLDLNVIRINVGGSVKADKSDAPFNECYMNTRAVPSPLGEDGKLDIRRDKGMYGIIQRALTYPGITDFTLFMNSPPSTMTVNGHTSGSPVEDKYGFFSNLREDCYEKYAEYVADVTQLYIEAGVPVKYVSPINEPQWKWDEYVQEGCHYSVYEVIRFLEVVVRLFNERAKTCPAMRDVRISMPETAQWHFPPTYGSGLYDAIIRNPLLREHADHFSGHSYGTSANDKREFKRFVDYVGAPLPIHQTEWGPLHADFSHPMEFALELANCMYEDFTILDCPHWTWWTGCAGFRFPSGLIDAEPDGSGYVLTKRYYVMMHHSRFIRGMTRIDAACCDLPDGVNVSAYISDDEKQAAAIVINNNEVPCRIRFEGTCPEGEVSVYLTDAEHDCARIGAPDADGFVLPARSVATVSFGGLKLVIEE